MNIFELGRNKRIVTELVGAFSLHLDLGLLGLLVKHRALHLQVVDHPLRQLDGYVFSLGVVEPYHPLASLRVLGAEGDHHVLVILLGRERVRGTRGAF